MRNRFEPPFDWQQNLRARGSWIVDDTQGFSLLTQLLDQSFCNGEENTLAEDLKKYLRQLKKPKAQEFITSAVDWEGNTPLHVAARKHLPQTVGVMLDFLSDKGSGLSLQNTDKVTPFDYVSLPGQLTDNLCFISLERVNQLRAILISKLSPAQLRRLILSSSGKEQTSFLHKVLLSLTKIKRVVGEASPRRLVELSICELLSFLQPLLRPADWYELATRADQDGKTFIHYAASHGFIEYLAMFLEKVDQRQRHKILMVKTRAGDTAAHSINYADSSAVEVFRGLVGLAGLATLLGEQAKDILTAPNESGNTVFHCLAPTAVCPEVEQAQRQESVSIMLDLLTELTQICTPEVVRRIIKLPNEHGMTVVHCFVCVAAAPEVLKYWLELLGEEALVVLEAPDRHGDTVFHLLAQSAGSEAQLRALCDSYPVERQQQRQEVLQRQNSTNQRTMAHYICGRRDHRGRPQEGVLRLWCTLVGESGNLAVERLLTQPDAQGNTVFHLVALVESINLWHILTDYCRKESVLAVLAVANKCGQTVKSYLYRQFLDRGFKFVQVLQDSLGEKEFQQAFSTLDPLGNTPLHRAVAAELERFKRETVMLQPCGEALFLKRFEVARRLFGNERLKQLAATPSSCLSKEFFPQNTHLSSHSTSSNEIHFRFQP